MAGDGTTTATVLAHGMIHEGLRCLSSGMNPMDLKRGMEKACSAVVAALKTLAQPCASSRDIAHVAAISANNDASVGELLAAAIDRVGRDGAITLEDGSGLVSTLEVVEGLQFARGYLSPYFINNTERQSVLLDDVAILLLDAKLQSLHDLLPLLEQVVQAGQPLLVIAEDLDSETLSGLVLNSLRGALKTCAVKAPEFGDRRRALMQDMAVLTGARLFGEAGAPPLAQATLADLGHARRVEVDQNTTTLIGGAGKPEAVQQRIAAIRKQGAGAASAQERAQLAERAARLAGGVALLKLGAATETELKERKLRVEDALHATRAAVEEGVVPGGGIALLRARHVLVGMEGANLDETSGIQLVLRALEAPLRCIVDNAGDEPSVVLSRIHASGDAAFGYNAATREYGDLLQWGIIDPAKVTRLALQNAVSIAALVLTTDCLITQAPEASLQQP
jgi:chaperonin GroEL